MKPVLQRPNSALKYLSKPGRREITRALLAQRIGAEKADKILEAVFAGEFLTPDDDHALKAAVQEIRWRRFRQFSSQLAPSPMLRGLGGMACMFLAGVLFARDLGEAMHPPPPDHLTKVNLEPAPESLLGLGASGENPSRGSCVLSIQTNGIWINNRPADADILASFIRECGSPSRTNQVTESKTVYVYDHLGVIVQRETPGDRQMGRILIDYDGEGGELSAREPFHGEVQIGTQSVQPTTTPPELFGQSQLYISGYLNQAGILRGRFGPYDLEFDYARRRSHLSAIKINFQDGDRNKG